MSEKPRALPYALPLKFNNQSRSRQLGQKQVNNIFDYNDPNQVNSMADVIAKSLNPNKNDGNGFTSFLSSSWDLFKRGTIDPMMQGDWKAVGINSLINFTETMDIAAAPTKAILQGNGIEGAKKALGIGVEGRQNYDYHVQRFNTAGNILSNFVLELVSDPMNWITLGLKGVVTGVAKSSLKSIVGDVAKEAGMELSQQAYKTVSKRLVESYLNKDITAFTKNADDMMTWMKQEGMFNTVDHDVVENFHTALVNAEQSAFHTMGANILQGVNTVTKKVDTAQTFLVRTALTPTVYPAYFALKKGGLPLAQYVARQIRTVGSKYSRPDGAMSFANLDEAIDVIRQHQNNMSLVWEKIANEKDVPKETLRELTKGVKRDYETIVNILRSNMYDAPKAIADISEYLKKMTNGKVDNINDYLQIISKANDDYVGNFGWEKKMYEDLSDIQEKILNINKTMDATAQMYAIDKGIPDELTKINDALKSTKNPVHQGLLRHVNESEDVFLRYMDHIDKDVYYSAIKYAPEHIIRNMDELRKAAALGEKMEPSQDVIKKMLNVAKGKVLRKSDKVSQLIHALQDSLKDERGFQEAYYNMLFNGTEIYKAYEDLATTLRQSVIYLNELPVDDRMKHLLPLAFDLNTALQKDLVRNKKALAEQVGHWLESFRDTGVWKPFNASTNTRAFKNTLEAYTRYSEALKVVDLLDIDKPTTNNFAKMVERKANIAEANAKVDRLMENSLNVSNKRRQETYEKVNKRKLAKVQQEITDILSDLHVFDDVAYMEEVGVNKLGLRITDLYLKLESLEKTKSEKLERITNFRNAANKRNGFGESSSSRVGFFKTQITKLNSEIDTINVQSKAITDAMTSLEKRAQEIQEHGIESTKRSTAVSQKHTRMDKFSEYAEPFIKTDALTLSDREKDILVNFLSIKLDNNFLKSPNAMSEYTNAYNDIVYLFNNRLTQIMSQTRVESTDAIIGKYDKLLKVLEKVNPIKYQDLFLQDEKNIILTQFQMEKFNMTLQLSTNGVIGDFLTQLRSKTGSFGHAIDVIKNDTSEMTTQLRMAIESLELYAESNYAYQNLLNKLAFLRISDNMKFAFASSLQNFARVDPGQLMSNPYWFDQLMQSMEDHLYSAYGNSRGALDFFRMRLIDPNDKWGKSKVFNGKSEWESEALRKIFVESGHANAGSDILMTELFIEEELPHLIESLKVFNKPIYVMDIESTGLNYNTEQIIQIAFKEYGKPIGETKQFKQLHPEEYFTEKTLPSLAVLKGLYGDLDSNELVKKYVADYSSKGGDITETQLLLRTLKEVPDDAIIIWHNGDNFDIPMILQRLENAGIPTDKFKKFLHVDTLSQYKQKQGGVAVSNVAYKQLREAMNQYCADLVELGATRTVSLNTTEMLNSLQMLSENFNKMYDRTTSTGTLAEAFNSIDEMAQQIKTTLNDIKSSNRSLNSMFVNNVAKADLKNLAAEEIQQMFQLTEKQMDMLFKEGEIDRTFYDLIQTKYRTNLLADTLGIPVEKLVEQYGDQMNLTRILRGDSSITQYGYKNVYDTEEVRKFFNFQQMTTPKRDLLRMYKFTKNVNKTANKKLKDLKLVEHFDLKQAMTALSDIARQGENYLSLIDPEQIFGTALQFATVREMWRQVGLKELYGILKRNGISISTTENSAVELLNYAKQYFPQINPELLDVLIDPFGIHTIGLFGTGAVSKVRQVAVKTLAQQFKAPYQYHEIYQQARNKFDGLQQISRALDNNKNWTAKGFAISSISQPLMDMLDRFIKMAPKEQDAHIALQRVAKEHMAAIEGCEVLSRSIAEPDYLLRTLLYDTPFMAFSTKGFNEVREYGDLLRVFLAKQPVFEEQGIMLHITDTYVYVGLRNDLALNTSDTNGFKVAIGNTSFEPIAHKEIPFKSVEEYKLSDEDIRIFEQTKEKLAYLSGGRSIGTIGGVLTAPTLEKLYERLPAAFRESTISLDQMKKIGCFQGMKFNRIVQGSIKYRADYTNMLDEELLLSNIKAVQHVANLTEQKYLYTDMYFNKASGFGLDETGIFRDISDDEVVSILSKSDEMIVAYLVADKSSQGYHVRPINVQSVADLQLARNLDAVCVPYQVYAASFKNINEHSFNNQFLDLWQKMIYLFKMGYLADPGVFLRNYLDSTLKTGLMTKDPLGTVASQVKACDMIAKHSAVVRDIVQMFPDKAWNDTTKSLYFRMFEGNRAKMTKKEFDFVDGFLTYGPSAGETKALQEAMKAKGHVAKTEGAWDTTVHVFDTLLTPTSKIEQIARLGEYIQLTKTGMTKTEAIMQVQKTHFDYGVKDKATMYTELLIPFYNFTRLNIEFWIKYAVENPWLMSVLNDFMSPIWDFDSISEDDINRNMSLQYQLLAGNMPLDASSGFIFKANPSYMDVYNTFTDPQNAVLSKLIAPVKNAISYETAEGAFAYGIFGEGNTSFQNASSLGDAIFGDSSSYPIWGAISQRYLKAGPTYAQRLEGHSIEQTLASFLPGTFGATKQWGNLARTRAVSKNSYLPYTKSGQYVWEHFYTDRFRRYARRSYSSMYYPSRQRGPMDRYFAKNWYSKYYTKGGQSRFKFRMQTTNAANLKNRIHDFQLMR